VLSEEDRQRIQQEEIFRQEIRRDLERARATSQSLGHRITRFLNTGLGLWFLTTVAVGLVSFSYTK
jgi:hypothetical protein